MRVSGRLGWVVSMRGAAVCGAAAVLSLTSGCTAEYLDRRDTLLLGAGEAVQTNIVAHVIDPWPVNSRRIYADTNGARLQSAQERYRSPQSGLGAAPSAAAPIPAPGGASAAR